MKHQAIFDRCIEELHSADMEADDKAFFDAECRAAFGEQFDKDIDKGIANGFSIEQQEGIVRAIFRACKT